jgi:tetratricopeptide (TPR) repeat protein
MMQHPERGFAAADLLFRQGRPEDAEAIYRGILKQAHDPLALHNLSVALYRQGRKDEALKYLRFAQHVSDLYPYLAATLRDMLEDPDCAQPGSPLDIMPVRLRAFALFREGAKYDAVKLLQASIAERPSTDLLGTMLSFLADPGCAAQIGDPLGGPFNGQVIRRSIFTDIVGLTQPSQIFETGTFLGATTAFMAGLGAGHVFSCEMHAYNHRYAAQRLRAAANATLVNRDSRSFLRDYLPCYCRGDAVVLFYLDAHWEEDLPLLDELALIAQHVRRPVVMVDDFEVPDDSGYSFDDYGPERRLTLGYLAPLAGIMRHRYFPSASDAETGSRRGCVVLTSDDELAAKLAQVRHLRPAP